MKIPLVVFTLLGLITLNVLTLVSDQIHSVGYGIIEASIASTVPDQFVNRVLSGSPTSKKQLAVSVATSELKGEFEKSNRAISARNAAMTKQLTDLSIKHANLEKSHAAIETKHTNLKQKTEKQTSVVSAISSRIGDRVGINGTRTFKSFARKAVPYAGLPILIYMTRLELQEACQTMKDLNALNFEFEIQIKDAYEVCSLSELFLG